MRDQALWKAILDVPVEMKLGNDKLREVIRRECQLSERKVEWVLLEYRKFLYLLAVTGENLRPSEVIDHVWNIHSGFPAPLPEGAAPLPDWPPKYVVRSRFLSWDPEYEATLARYAEEFGPVPSQLIWPSVWRIRSFVIVLALSFGSVPAMAAGLKAGGLWSILFPVGLIVLFVFLPIAIVFAPWSDRREK